MEVLLDIIHAFDYDILVQIADHWRGGFSDTVWTAISMLGNGGALWIITALILLFFRKTRRAGAAMLVALLIGLLVAVIGGSMGPLTGFALNPARDFGPKVFEWLAGWGTVAFTGGHQEPGRPSDLQLLQ